MNVKSLMKDLGLYVDPNDVPEEMKHNVGRKLRYLNWEPKMGTIARDFTFTVREFQKDYRGELCYRIYCDGFDDRVGRPLNPARESFEFVRVH
ncbi:hypothetical protein [Dyella telluris]|uniref:Uncharacterized protein n=1 Tax=Dyella telluris TaxID=2763498 RepID=A0A7G8Q4J7_9GAMM|nr:hypothetical protein [Dyella telluris]QNK01705.1 hypothetical protein H8F01_00550 [Dyella telluris]